MKRPDAADFSDHDLAFRPADPAGAATLTAAQIEHYNARGFVPELDVFTAEEAADLRAYLDDLLAGRDSYSILGYHLVCQRLHDVVTEPRILRYVRDILGDEVVCWGTQVFAKQPHDGKEVPFHQDAVYWPFTPSHTTTVWLAIDDVDDDNAPMQFVPGSHLGGPIPHEVLELDGTRVLGRRALGMDGRPDSFADVLRAGQCSLHNDLLLHGSAPNGSDRRRAGLTLRYTAAEVRVMDGFDEWGVMAVHVLDGDPSGSWRDVPRPEGEHPERMPAIRPETA